jgi:hypothetical protein
LLLSETEEEPLTTKLPTGQVGLGYVREHRPSMCEDLRDLAANCAGRLAR